jgi:hypothetical protein
MLMFLKDKHVTYVTSLWECKTYSYGQYIILHMSEVLTEKPFSVR